MNARLVWALPVAMILAVSLTRLLLASTGGGSIPVDPLAYSTLTKYASNPLITLGAGGSWNAEEVDGESVFWDRRTGQWVMAAGGYTTPPGLGGTYKIGLWYSDDLLAWTPEASNPVFSPNAGEGNAVAPYIVQLDDLTYRMYYQSYSGADGGPRIYVASSADLTSWTRLNSGDAILVPGSAGAWDSEVVFDPAVKIWGGRTYLFYGGQKDTAGTKTRGIGLVSSADGVTFSNAASPIFTPTGGELQVNLGAIGIVGDNPTDFHMWHDSSTVSGERFICHVHTSDGGATWDLTEHEWLTPSVSGWDDVQVFDSAPVVKAGVLYFFYAGSEFTGASTGLEAKIGLATMRWP